MMDKPGTTPGVDTQLAHTSSPPDHTPPWSQIVAPISLRRNSNKLEKARRSVESALQPQREGGAVSERQARCAAGTGEWWLSTMLNVPTGRDAFRKAWQSHMTVASPGYVLQQGDQIFLPPIRRKQVTLETGKRRRIVLHLPKVRLVVRVRASLAGEPSSLAAKLRIQGREEVDVTIEDGVLDHMVPLAARRAVLVLPPADGESDEAYEEIPLKIGGLDPISTVSGLRMRLARLGYPCRRSGDEVHELDEGLLACVDAFQRGEDIDDPEEPYGRATLDALKTVLDEEFDT